MIFFVPVVVEGELIVGALVEPFTSGGSEEMSLAVTVERMPVEGAEGALVEGVTVTVPELMEEPDEGVETCFGLEVVARTVLVEEDFATLGEALGDVEFPEFTIKFTRAVAAVEEGFTILALGSGIGVVVKVLGFPEGVMMVVSVFSSDDALPAVIIGIVIAEDLPDFSVRLACSLRVLSISFFVLSSCMATFAYES